MQIITDFFHMGGYAFYVWSSYGSVFAFLLFTWLMPRCRWKKYVNE